VQNRTWCQQRTFLQGNSPHIRRKIQASHQNLHGWFQERLGYAVIWNHQKITKIVRPQNTIYSAEQSAIMTAIHNERTGEKSHRYRLTLIAASEEGYKKKPENANNKKTT
jgi:hypothetical protein